MINFPSSLPMPDLPFEEQYEDPGMRTSVENGPSLGRRKFTKRRLSSVKLNWEKIPLSINDYNILQTFLNSVGGSALNFNWIHPVTHVSYVMCVSEQGSFKYGSDDNPTWSGGIVIKEA